MKDKLNALAAQVAWQEVVDATSNLYANKQRGLNVQNLLYQLVDNEGTKGEAFSEISLDKAMKMLDDMTATLKDYDEIIRNLTKADRWLIAILEANGED